MEVLTQRQHRVLAFVAAANGGGHLPNGDEVAAWLKSPRPVGAIGLSDWLRFDFFNLNRIQSDSQHLVEIGWLEGDDSLGLQLTPLGRALLRWSNAGESEGTVVLLEADSPVAYPTLVGHLAGMGDGLILDPYLGVDQVHDLISHTSLSRALIKNEGNAGRQGAIATLLASTGISRSFEVRLSDRLHDRTIVGGDGRVWTIGKSLNGVGGRSGTVLSPVPSAAATALAKEAEDIWSEASILASSDDAREANSD